MSFIRRARRARVSKAGVAFLAALAMGTTSAAIWAATTATAATPDTIWGTTTPANAVVDSDTAAVELGTRFTATTAGQATGVRFYKTVENRGSHTGALWSSTGTLLAMVSFSGETSTGWQTASFAKPVTLTGGTSYVVSYHTTYGRYSATERYTGTSASANLRIPTSNVGVYSYGTTSNFPTNTWHASQYWVDLTFAKTASGTASTPASATSATSATTSPTSTVTPTASSTSTSASPSVTATSTSAKPTATTSPATTSTAKPTATASSSISSSATSAGLTNCVSLPSRCGYPDATNTGIPAGTTLLRVPQDVTSGTGWVWDSRGWLQASSGAVVSNLIISGPVNASGANITIQNSRILVNGENWGIGLSHTTNALVANNEIGIVGATPRLLTGIKDVNGDDSGTQVLRNNIQNVSTGIQVHEGMIADNYIHDMGYSAGDHTNGTMSNGATTMMTIRHNTILNKFDQTDAISLFQDFGVEANRLVTDNLLAGGGYTLYAGGGSKGLSSNIKITNNRFSNIYFSSGGSYGNWTAFDSSGSGNVASGNFWDNSLAPVNI